MKKIALFILSRSESLMTRKPDFSPPTSLSPDQSLPPTSFIGGRRGQAFIGKDVGGKLQGTGRSGLYACPRHPPIKACPRRLLLGDVGGKLVPDKRLAPDGFNRGPVPDVFCRGRRGQVSGNATQCQKPGFLALLILSVVCTVWGCATIVDQQVLDEPSASFEGVHVTYRSLFEPSPVFHFKVVNPNPVGMKIRNITYDLNVNGKKFIKGVTDKGMIYLKPVGSDELSLSVTFNCMDVFEPATFIRSDKVAYELTGTIGVGSFAVPYQTKGEVRLPKLPEIFLKHVDISDFSLTRPFTVIFIVCIENTCPCPVVFDTLYYRMEIGGQEFANGHLRHFSPVSANGMITLRIPSTVTSSEINWAENNLLTDDLTEYELSGEMSFYIPRIGERRFPFHKQGSAPFYSH